MFQLVPFLLRKEYGGGSYPSACPIMPVLGKGPEGQPAFPFSGKTEKNMHGIRKQSALCNWLHDWGVIKNLKSTPIW